MADAQEFLSVLGEFQRFLCYFRIESLKNARITITHHTCLFQCIGVAASDSSNFLEPRQMLMHEKTCMIPIILFINLNPSSSEIGPGIKHNRAKFDYHKISRLTMEQTFDNSRAPHTYKVARSLAIWFQSKRFMKGLKHKYGHGGLLGHVPPTNFYSPDP